MAVKEVTIPDIGDFEGVDVIEVLVSKGDVIDKEDPLITLESDKASMEVPSPYKGKVEQVSVKVGDKVSQGDQVVAMEVEGEDGEAKTAAGEGDKTAAAEKETKAESESEPKQKSAPSAEEKPATGKSKQDQEGFRPPPLEPVDEDAFANAYASPSVRRFARELGVDLGRVQGSGRKSRILKEDVQAYVKSRMSQPSSGAMALPSPPDVDFSKFGETETRPLSRIQKISSAHLHRSWVGIPHVTQFDEADITELEAFRQENKDSAKQQGVKLTMLPFIMKACASALKTYPNFNASLHPDGEHLIVKKYIHIGIAVDTDEGLVVPVVRDADKKGVYDLARELTELSEKARNKKLSPGDMQGACFSISNLGGIGGTAFTPIINAPEVAILGVSRSTMKPVYMDGEFQPRLMLPLSLSYDHRVIDGAKAARFSAYLSAVLSDIRKVLL